MNGVAASKRRILSGYRWRAIFWMARLLPNGYAWLLKHLSQETAWNQSTSPASP